jgi:O-antigen/teichoic acid export membrane protein
MPYSEKYQEFVALLPLKNWSLVLLVTNLLTIFVVALMQPSLPPVVPIFYGNPYGPGQLAAQWSLVLPAMSALGFCLLSILVGILNADDFLKKILFGSMVAATTLSLVTTVKIILLVGNI